MASNLVLVVDDEHLIRWAVSERLNEMGLDVVVAKTGAEAEARFDESIDAVLLDIRLPDASGLDLLVRFLSLRPSCPIIMMTAYSFEDQHERAYALGARALVPKPFDVDEVAERIQQALNGG